MVRSRHVGQPTIADMNTKRRLPPDWPGVRLQITQAVKDIKDVSPFEETCAQESLKTMFFEMVLANPGRKFVVGPYNSRIVEEINGKLMVWSLHVQPGWKPEEV